jgi:hypothetical protein
MNMRRKIPIIWAVLAAGCVILTWLAAQVAAPYALGVLFLAVIAGIMLMSLSCPRCSHLLLYREQRAFGAKFHAFTAWGLPDKCPNCGCRIE